MMEKKAVCDRIEDGICVFLADTGEIFHLPVSAAHALSASGENPCEGESLILSVNDAGEICGFIVDRAETEQRRVRIASLLDRLFSKDEGDSL